MELDILSIAAHQDDSELTCGGTLIKMAQAGYKVGVLDLTAGETGSRGNEKLRKKEADCATRVMGLCWRGNLDLPDAGIEHTLEYKHKIAEMVRKLRPKTVILPYWEGRHPDHYTTGHIGYEACFLAGLRKLALGGKAHRPHKILYASLYVPSLRPTFVVDITQQFEKKCRAVLCYASQFSDERETRNLFPARRDLKDHIGSLGRHVGLMGGVKYAEPFVTREVALVDDIVKMPVASI